ncbi:hypothetical protein M0G74_10845 [Microbulbifer sp. CAU 1566]|uniref:hypothetical protein n=1 Tax=Microbulbifer sp. CAU 1566 TaxID=2933269 RepID=UPI00200580DD|nr:hypothetical protein [Microbulbifer sp. CAU 1566]MCK7597767.1 hypothetical protein [Microbulbifer sp. CAU 1566]
MATLLEGAHYSELSDLGKYFLKFFFREKLFENQSVILPFHRALGCPCSGEGANYTSLTGRPQAVFENFFPAR